MRDAPQFLGQTLLKVLLILVKCHPLHEIHTFKIKGCLAQLGFWCESKLKVTDESFSLNWDCHKEPLKCTARFLFRKVNAKWQLRVLFTFIELWLSNKITKTKTTLENPFLFDWIVTFKRNRWQVVFAVEVKLKWQLKVLFIFIELRFSKTITKAGLAWAVKTKLK